MTIERVQQNDNNQLAAEFDEKQRALRERLWKESESRKSDPPSVDTQELWVQLDRALVDVGHLDALINVAAGCLRDQDCELADVANVLADDAYGVLEELKHKLECAMSLIQPSNGQSIKIANEPLALGSPLGDALEDQRQKLWQAQGIVECLRATCEKTFDKWDSRDTPLLGSTFDAAIGIMEKAIGDLEGDVLMQAAKADEKLQ